MITDYDDDTHFCLKCHLTILGLDNYVAHRKAGCSKAVVEPSKSPLPSQLLPPDESFGLKADDFFSSLELQSSAKKVQAPSTSGKNFSGILTRSKTTAVIQATKDQIDPGQSKSGKNIWIGGQELKLGYGDNQSKLIKAVDNLERRKDEPEKLETYEDSEDESEDYDYDDAETSDEDHEHPPRGFTGGKWKPASPIQWNRSNDWNTPPPSYTGGKWKPGLSKRSSSPPPTHTKGKWKPEKYDDDIPPPTFTGSKWVPSKKHDYNTPPTNYTKGKWKPRYDDESPSPTHTKGKWKPKNEEDYPPPEHTKGKWKPLFEESPIKDKCKSELDKATKLRTSYPPPDHTKGKWKPISEEISPKEKTAKSKLKFDEDIPPPDYTKGKWKPITPPEQKEKTRPSPSYTKGKWLPQQDTGKKVRISDDSVLRKSEGELQYWCRPCNRSLASKIIYERHIKSELHFKRTFQDKEFDEDSFNNLKDRRIKKKLPDDIFITDNQCPKPKKRTRKKIFEKCSVCNSKVNKYLIGKHMISHFHCRKGNLKSKESQKMILDNIISIVRQSPFQCSICKYYCNTEEAFLEHWLSEFHAQRDLKTEGHFYCTFCTYQAENSLLMYEHFQSEGHKEVISVINRSVPIIIKKITKKQCLTCHKSFSLNIQLIKHCETHKHSSSNVNQFKNNYICCNSSLKSAIALKRHRKKFHKEIYYICSVCDLTFKSTTEATNHRRSIEHRYARSKGNATSERECNICNEKFEHVLKLNEHIKNIHPEASIKCPHCGMSFQLPQALSAHLRQKSCNLNPNTVRQKSLTCEQCFYSTDSQSELIYHKVLHGDPLIISSGGPRKTNHHYYRCPICEKLFPKSSLLGHLRFHIKERPFVCKICNKGFVRKNNLMEHKRTHDKNASKTRKTWKEKSFLCSTCGANFKKRNILQQHMLTHTGKFVNCPFPGCIYTARKESEIKSHYVTHLEEKTFCCGTCDYKGKSKAQLTRHMNIHTQKTKYQCPFCPFTTRLSAHLKRHSRVHTGAKPYHCPHCQYKCSSLDNLRKHVLSTNKHPGKCIYECKFCTENHFQSNFDKEFKAHLVTQHRKLFGNSTKAASYVTGIYNVVYDSTSHNDAATVDMARPDERDSSMVIEPKEDNIIHLTADDPIVAQICSGDIPTSSVTISTASTDMDEMLPLYVIPKDDNVYIENPGDTWNVVVEEESGVLVPFENNDSDTLFVDHF